MATDDYPDTISCGSCGDSIEVRSADDSDIYIGIDDDTLCRRCCIAERVDVILEHVEKLQSMNVDVVPLQGALRQLSEDEDLDSYDS